MQVTLKVIRFLAVVWIVAALLAVSRVPIFAAPNARDCSGGNAAILAPVGGGTVFGIVQIEGTASLGGEFRYYKLEVVPVGTEAWGDLAGQAAQQVVNGQLGVWDSAAVPDGAYSLRLRVVDPTGNYCEAIVTNILVQNSTPPTLTPEVVVSPTPQETEAPPIQNAVPTPLPTTPSAQETGTPEPTETPNAGPTETPEPGAFGGIEIDQIIGAATDLATAIGRIFLFGVIAMAGIFFFVGVVYFVRRVL